MKDRSRDTAGRPAVPNVGNISFIIYGGDSNPLGVKYNGQLAMYTMQEQNYVLPTTYQYSSTSGTIELSSSVQGPPNTRFLYTSSLWNYMLQNASKTGNSMDVTIVVDTGVWPWKCVKPQTLISKNGSINVDPFTVPGFVSTGGGC
jgi:hypothetical protein